MVQVQEMPAQDDEETPGKRGRGRPPKPITPAKSARSRLGRAMRQIRENEGLSLADFAARSTYSEGHLSRVEHGEVTPSRELVEAYEKHLQSDGLFRSLYEMILEEQRLARLARRGRSSPGSDEAQREPPETRPGDRSELVADLTLPDGSMVVAGEPHEKGWRLRNVGIVAWRGRELERIGPCSGPATISSPRRVPVPETDPGETVDVTVRLEAPMLPGTAIAYWQMVDSEGRACFPDRYADGIYALLVVRGQR